MKKLSPLNYPHPNQQSRKSVKRVDTNGGFPKILKKKPKHPTHASNANITMRTKYQIAIGVAMELVAMDVLDRERKWRMTTITNNIRTE